jgi:hypothetical protein
MCYDVNRKVFTMRIAKRKNFKKVIIAIAATIVVVGGYFVVAKIANLWPFEQAVETTSIVDGDKTSNDDKNSASSGITSEKTRSEDNNPSNSNSGSLPVDVTPNVPVGTFVSNHQPNLSGYPAPSQMSSTCTTTAGAYCLIQFTQDGVIKALPEKQTDSSGNVSWYWQLSDIGLAAGDWQVSAIARNGSLTSTATDGIILKVGE